MGGLPPRVVGGGRDGSHQTAEGAFLGATVAVPRVAFQCRRQ